MTVYSLDVRLFSIWNQSAVPCPVLTVASWPAYRFLKRKQKCQILSALEWVENGTWLEPSSLWWASWKQGPAPSIVSLNFATTFNPSPRREGGNMPSHINGKIRKEEKFRFDKNLTLFFTRMYYFRVGMPGSTEIKLPKSTGSLKKQESSRRTSFSALVTMPNPLTVWITTICEKFLKRWEFQTTWPASWEICMQVKKLQLEMDMEQQTGSKLGKVYKTAYCNPAYLTYMQHTSCEMLG